ncbi:cytochrome B [Rhodanobacter sp. FW510-R12]|uniref:cytochrome b/b6 domain-containing protein n=1 Tax=unclassified Rhodanobacter TaxID=2621553 RepID=UPI0007A9B23A|nr:MULTISPECIES: cytochrome b/b6 domain-containing protein [unclassified Rhodanobacter]KZC15406.1 cytochrome B [Rhodanobacter sp. FW104-R8]KZC25541.1 cytochrome B [Rhodanobacter sp. FW510-T8]KZC29685.1 cytochrome B [Rhodanobacter sp. FW510-R10]
MNATVKVWDPLVRVFHWSLAGLFLANFFTEDGELVHRGIGYALLALLAVRFAWGWVGTRHARFSDWVLGPRRVRDYLRERLVGRSRRQLGHNPGAAMMILALLAGVLLVGLTGWLQTTDAFFGTGWLEELHEVLAYGVLALVGVHVLAAVGESVHYGENLVASMIHGRKRALEQDDAGGGKMR